MEGSLGRSLPTSLWRPCSNLSSVQLVRSVKFLIGWKLTISCPKAAPREPVPSMIPTTVPMDFSLLLSYFNLPYMAVSFYFYYEVCARNAGNDGDRTSHKDSKEEDVYEKDHLGIWWYHNKAHLHYCRQENWQHCERRPSAIGQICQVSD